MSVGHLWHSPFKQTAAQFQQLYNRLYLVDNDVLNSTIEFDNLVIDSTTEYKGIWLLLQKIAQIFEF